MNTTFSISEIDSARDRLGDLVLETPTWQWRGAAKDGLIGSDTEVLVKLELFQYGGSFKVRGALSVMLDMTPDQLARGVTAISAGNHAIAVGYAANVLGTHAKVVMPENSPHLRIEKCREMGAEVVLVENAAVGFERVKEIEQSESRMFVHPFDGPLTSLGTATLGLEFYRQASQLDIAIIPVGGGGLASGMAAAIKQCNADCEIYGVEPDGANSMFLSFQSGKPERIDEIRTIAKSLGAPFALPYSFELCRQHLKEIVLVSDHQMCQGMRIMFEELKLAVEPAAAAGLAALRSPLKEIATGKRVGIIACGSNIDLETFHEYLSRATKPQDSESAAGK